MFKVLGKIFELQSFQFEASKRKIKKKEKGKKKKEKRKRGKEKRKRSGFFFAELKSFYYVFFSIKQELFPVFRFYK